MILKFTSLNRTALFSMDRNSTIRNWYSAILMAAVLFFFGQTGFGQAPPVFNNACPSAANVILPAGGGTITFTTTNIPALLGVSASDPDGVSTITYSASPVSIDCGDIGVIPINVTATDIDGSANCSVVTTIIDGGPLAVCANFIAVLDGAGNVTVDAADIDGGSSSCTGITMMTIDGAASQMYDCNDIGSFPVTLQVTSASGSDDCIATVTVVDNIPPSIANCPANGFSTTSVGGTGDCAGDFAWTHPTITDNCPGTSLMVSYSGATTMAATPFVSAAAASGTFNLGVTTVTYIVSDGTNAGTPACSFTVTITDDEAPAIANCPVNGVTTTSVGGTGDCAGNFAWTHPSITDNCPGTSLLVSYSGATTMAATAFSSGAAASGAFNLGVTTVSYTISDGTNAGTPACSFTVTVSDDEAPAITNCPANSSSTTSVGGTGDCAGDFSWTHPTLSDNCSIATSTYTLSGATTQGSTAFTSGTPVTETFNIGVTTVTYAVSDGTNNGVPVCSFTVTITDDEPPIPINPGNISVNNLANNCFAQVIWPGLSASDNCPGSVTVVYSTVDPKNNVNNILISQGVNDGGDFPVGVSIVSYTVTDIANNTATGSFTVTVIDTEAPNIICPPAQTLQFANCNANAMVPDYRSLANISDNCPLSYLTITQSPAPGTLLSAVATPADGETFNVTITATDPNAGGTSSFCTFVVTLEESNEPQPSTAGLVLPAINYECGPLTITAPTALDECGNLICGEPFPPVAINVGPPCIGASGSCTTISRSNTTVTNIPDNNPGGVNSIINVPTGTPALLEDVNISLEVTHTWVGDLKVSLTSPNGTTVVIFDRPGNPATFFGCAGNDLDVTFDDAATNTYANFEATCGNLPAISGTFQSSVPLAMFNLENPVGDWILNISDNAGGDTGTLDEWTLDLCVNASQDQITQYEFPLGTHNITWVYDDGNGNSTSQLQQINVMADTEGPTFNCQALAVQLDANGMASITPADLLESASITLTSGDNGSTNLGNTLFTITVPSNVTFSFDWDFNNPDPFFEVFGYFVNGVGTGLANVTSSGSTTVSLLAGDEFSFVAQTVDNLFGPASVTITNFSPGFSGAYSLINWTFENQNADGTFASALGEAADNCDAEPDLTYSVSPSTFDCGDIGVQNVTVTVTDLSGNSSTCNTTVTVSDNTPPTFNPLTIPVATIAADCGNIPAVPAAPTATDNCDSPFVNFTSSSTQTGNPNNCGNYNYTITRTWTATDNSGNATSVSQVITVTDNNAPTNISFSATGPAGAFANGASINPNLNQCVATVSLSINGLSDCASINTMDFTYQIDGGPVVNGNGFTNVQFNASAHTVVFTVTDPCGNVATTSFDFVVTDGIEPVASCVNSLNLGLPSSGILVLSPNAVNNNSFDNCTPANALILSISPDTFTCEHIGMTIPVELFVSDGALEASCTTTVTIQDNVDPTAQCQPITISLDANGMASITAADINNGSFDNCNFANPGAGIDTMWLNQYDFGLADAGTTTTVMLTVRDSSGNTDSCPAAVTVIIDQTCFDVGAAVGGAGQIINLPVEVEAFTNVSGFQFSFDINPDDAFIDRGEFVGVTNIHPALSSNFLVTFDQDVQPTNTPLDTLDVAMPLDSIIYDTLYFTNTINISWQGLPEVTLPDGTSAFDLQILLTGNIGEVGVVTQIQGVIPEVSYNYGGNFFMDTPCFINGGFQINKFIIAGDIRTETGAPVGMAIVDLDDIGGVPIVPVDQQTTMSDGLYEFEVFNSGDYRVTPSKNINWKNGVNIDDVVKMQQHAVGANLVNSAYKKIAADANNDGLITTFDAVLTNNFVLNFISGAAPPPNQSWRFVDAKQMLANDPNVIVPPFTEVISFMNLITDTINNDFIGVKIGDLTGDANPATFNGNADDKSDTSLKFVTTNTRIVANETVSLDFTAKDFNNLVGYQWALAFDKDVLSFEGMTPGSLLNLSDNNVGTASLEDGLVFFTWYTTNGVTMKEDEVLFTLHFHAMKDGIAMKDLIKLQSFDGFNLAAFDAAFAGRTIELSFVKDDNTAEETTYAFELMQNQPNPFKAETNIGFTLPYDTYASIQITDATGRLLKLIEGNFVKGYNQVTLTKSELSASGVVYYQLETTEFTATKKMIIIE